MYKHCKAGCGLAKKVFGDQNCKCRTPGQQGALCEQQRLRSPHRESPSCENYFKTIVLSWGEKKTPYLAFIQSSPFIGKAHLLTAEPDFFLNDFFFFTFNDL